MKKFIAVCTAFFMCMTASPQVTFAEDEPDASGTYYNITWEYDGATKTVTLSGEGTLEVYGSYAEPDTFWKDKVEPNGQITTRRIEHVIVKDGITALGTRGLSAYYDALDITLPSTLKTIAGGALTSNYLVKEIIIPDGVTSIGGQAFVNCEMLERVVLPDSVTDLPGKGMFTGCMSLKEVRLPSHITELQDNMFSGCISLTELNLPDSIETVGKRCFMDCPNLVLTHLPEQLRTVGEWGMEGCQFAEDINIPPHLTETGWFAFPLDWAMHRRMILSEDGYLYSLWNPVESFDYDSFNHVIVEYGANPNYEEDIVLPDSVTIIGSYAFQLGREHYSSFFPVRFHSLTIPPSVREIRENAFYCASFDEIRGYSGTYAQEYANGNGYKFVALDDEADAVKPAYGERTLSISNTSNMLGSGYTLNEWHEAVLREKNGNNPITIKDKEEGWEGSCFGLAVFQILLDTGIVSPAEFGAETIPEIQPTTENISFINCLHQVSSLPMMIAEYSDQTKLTQKQILARMIICSQKVNAGANPYLINIRTKNGMHAIVGYGMESGEWEWDGAVYDRRILLWDSNYPGGDARDNLYYNTETMHWCIPVYGLSYAETEGDAGALLYAVENTPDIFRYFTERIHPLPGDVNGDAQLSIADAVLLCRTAAEDERISSLTGQFNMDTNADGFIDLDDALYVLRKL